jgi:NADPH:quinone reductase-like Zn-dependent oxidoreductase
MAKFASERDTLKQRSLVARWLARVLALLTIAVVSLALVLSHNSPCAPTPTLAAGIPAMKAVMRRCYGPPEVLTLEEIARPAPAPDELLVKVRTAALNQLDWYNMRGEPYLIRKDAGIGTPQTPRMGVDFSGTVEAIGNKVTRFKPGDEVFGSRSGALAEYVSVRESGAVAMKPENISHEQAAAVPIAAVTALQALRDHGRVTAGQKVFLNGASGGVGTFAVQIAKAIGAEVTGVCGTRNAQMVSSLGAHHVIDYTLQDFTADDDRYDVIVDAVGNHPLRRLARVIEPHGILIIVGRPSDARWLGSRAVVIKVNLYRPFVDRELKFMRADPNPRDLSYLAELLQSGELVPAIDRRYSLQETPQAMRYLETGRARGKVVIDVSDVAPP